MSHSLPPLLYLVCLNTLSLFLGVFSCSSSQLNSSLSISLLIGADFVVPFSEFFFGPGSNVDDTSCIEIELMDDNVIENTERIGLQLQPSEAVTLVSSEDEAEVIILDNEGELLRHELWEICSFINI